LKIKLALSHNKVYYNKNKDCYGERMAIQKEVVVVDASTGEVYGPRPRKIKRTEAFYMVTQKEAIDLAKQGLTAKEHDVLLYLQGIADYENVAQVAQSFLAKEINTTEVTVSNAIKHLCDLDILRRVTVNGRKGFEISTKVCTRGKIK
jgi:hypothetical protein